MKFLQTHIAHIQQQIIPKIPWKRKSPYYERLKTKWQTRSHQAKLRAWENHKDAFSWLANNVKQMAVSSMGSFILLTTPPVASSPVQMDISVKHEVEQAIDNRFFIISDLSKVIPKEIRPLTRSEENQTTKLLSDRFNLAVTPELEGVRLERNYGLIGAEQHLFRYPGDSLDQHLESNDDRAMFGPSGIAPGLGAWGYFAPSQSQFTQKDKEREKYYLAIQTFLAPGYNEHAARYNNFFKYRKMLVVNSVTGQAVVAVIADVGPSVWTGKHLGGSPEDMHYLGLGEGPRKGPVLFFFIDDPKDTVPLGPIQMY